MYMDVVTALTATQNGLVTTAQVLATGATRSWLKWAVDDGRLIAMRRGVYRVNGAPLSPYIAVAAGVLAAGDGVGAAYFAAGWLWDAADIAPAAPDLLAFDNRQVRLRGVRVRRTHLASGDWLTTRHDVRTVTAPLMIVQLATVSSDLAIAVARDLRTRNLVGYRGVLDCLDATDFRTKPGLRTYCERALRVRGHDDSPAANALGAALIDAGLPAFETQYQVVVEGRVCLLDFAWPDHMVGLEYMGRADHGPDQMDRDARRRTQLTAVGWRILDVTGAMSHVDVIRWVAQALHLAGPFSLGRVHGPN